MAASDPSIGKLHHIGLAVPDLDAAMAHYAKLPGASVGPEFTIPGLGRVYIQRHNLIAATRLRKPA